MAHNIEGFGNMYLAEAPFLLLGFFFLLGLKKSPEKNLAIFWFLIAPIAASITKDAPHSNRMLAIQPMLSVVVAFGMYYSFVKIKPFLSKQSLKATVSIVCLMFILNIGIYIDRYFVHFPRNETEYWGNGWKALSEVLSDEKFKAHSVIVGRPEYSPYIFLSFYQKTDPVFFQNTVVRYPPTRDSFVHVKKSGRYEFRTIDWGKDLQGANKLVVSFPQDVPESINNARSRISIVLPNGRPMFYIFESQ